MAEEANLPEEIIVYIISWLPIKSLLKFTSVCKRWRSIILFDPHFANQHWRNKTLNRRLLICTQARLGVLPELESLDLETLLSSAGDDSLRRKVNFPFQPKFDGYGLADLKFLGSCNGLVVLAHYNVVYVFNPLTRLVKELPRQRFPANVRLAAYGFGYLSATDEYKVFVSYLKRDEYEYEYEEEEEAEEDEDEEEEEEEEEYEYEYEDEDWEEEAKEAEEDEDEELEEDLPSCQMISSKDQGWRRIEDPMGAFTHVDGERGTLVNEALHWLYWTDSITELIAFDLVKEEFRKMQQPDYGQDGERRSFLAICFGGCLCVMRYPFDVLDTIDFWVMREYQVSESWTKLLNLRFSNPERGRLLNHLLITENCIITRTWEVETSKSKMVRIFHKQGEKEPSLDIDSDMFDSYWSQAIEYEESLISFSG